MLGSRPGKAVRVCGGGAEPLLVETEEEKGPDLARGGFVFVRGFYFSPPVGRGVDGKEGSSGTGSCMT